MRIAIVGADGNGSLARCFINGAREQGVEAHPVFAPALIGGRRPLFVARRVNLDAALVAPLVGGLTRRIAAIEPDLVLVVKGRFIDARGVARLRRVLGVPILNYYPDDPCWPGHDDRRMQAALPHYDEVLVWSERVADGVRGLGASARVVAFGYDPTNYAPPAGEVRRRHDVALIGQRYGIRDAYVEPLADLRVLVSGTGWSESPSPVVRGIASTRTYSAAEIALIYAESGVALNILAPWNVPNHNMRTFEIPATATPMVATRTPEHEQLFGDDGAILVDSPEEARERILDLLSDPDRLRAIGKRGRERIAPFTYARRMQELLAPWR